MKLIIALNYLGIIRYLVLKKTHEAIRIDRSSCVHLAFIVHLALAFALRSRSAFAHRSPFTHRLPNSVLRSHTVHSACVQRSFIVRSSFAHRSWESRTFQGLYQTVITTVSLCNLDIIPYVWSSYLAVLVKADVFSQNLLC